MYGGLKAAWVAGKRSERKREINRMIPCRSGKVGCKDWLDPEKMKMRDRRWWIHLFQACDRLWWMPREKKRAPWLAGKMVIMLRIA